jgi:hypothetical protein
MGRMDVMACNACGAALSRPARQLRELPKRQFVDEDRVSMHPTLEPGTWAVDPAPRLIASDGTASTEGCLVMHPDDATGLEPHPDALRNSGCCGHDGLDGPNRRCASCHNDVATLTDDCWTAVELRFEPAAVHVLAAM